MNQSELEANACNWCQARENACERGTICFGFASHDWLRKWREFVNQSQSAVKQTRNFLFVLYTNNAGNANHWLIRLQVLSKGSYPYNFRKPLLHQIKPLQQFAPSARDKNRSSSFAKLAVYY